jgi:hypothetical protein
MKRILRSAFVVAAAVGAIGLSACEPEPPPDTGTSQLVEPEAIPEGETLADGVRETLADVLRDRDIYSRARRLGALLPTLGPELVPAVKQTIEDPTLDFGAIEFELLLHYWATHEPEEASRWAVERAPAFFRIAAILSALTRWAELDPQAAKHAADEWGALYRDMRLALSKALVRGWFIANPTELQQFIHDLGAGISQQRALTTYIRVAIQRQGYEAVTRWAESLPDNEPAYKKDVYWQVGSALALFNLEAGLSWCEAHCDGPYGKDLRSSISRRWARTGGGGGAALEWLLSAPESFEKDFALRVTFEEWSGIDRDGAMAWMATPTSGELDPRLQPILPIYARLLAADSPADGIQWAEQIEHDKKRRFVLIEIARAWRQADEAATEAWLQQSPLSEEDREKVLAPEWDRRI